MAKNIKVSTTEKLSSFSGSVLDGTVFETLGYSTAGDGGVQGNTEPGSASHTLNKFASGTSTALTDSDFLNNSIIRATVSYRI